MARRGLLNMRVRRTPFEEFSEVSHPFFDQDLNSLSDIGGKFVFIGP